MPIYKLIYKYGLIEIILWKKNKLINHNLIKSFNKIS
jgi:hypothetical protein